MGASYLCLGASYMCLSCKSVTPVCIFGFLVSKETKHIKVWSMKDEKKLKIKVAKIAQKKLAQTGP